MLAVKELTPVFETRAVPLPVAHPDTLTEAVEL